MKICCSRKAWSERANDFADSYVKIFGGNSALAARQKMRAKDPKRNASPSSGNAISSPKASNAVMPEIELKVFPTDEKMAKSINNSS